MKTATQNTGQHSPDLTFTPEVEKEWQQLRATIQDEYRQERRQVMLKVAGFASAGVMVVLIAAAGMGLIQ